MKRRFAVIGILCAIILTQAATGQDVVMKVVIGDMSGDAKPKPGELNNPFGVDFDSQGIMYIGELAGERILQFDGSGKLQVLAGDGTKGYTGDNGPAKLATFNGIHNVAVTPQGDIFISDAWNHCIRKIDGATKAIETFAGSGQPGFGGDGGPASQATFYDVMCVSFSPDFANLYVVDLKNRRVRVIEMASQTVRTIAGNGEQGVPTDGELAVNSPLVDPRAVAVDSKGNVYVLERGGHALRVVRPDGKIFTLAGTGKKGNHDGPALQASFNSPKHLCLDPSGKVYIADEGNHAIRVYHPATAMVETLVVKVSEQRYQLSRPHGVTVHRDGTLFVVDSGNHRILKTD